MRRGGGRARHAMHRGGGRARCRQIGLRGKSMLSPFERGSSSAKYAFQACPKCPAGSLSAQCCGKMRGIRLTGICKNNDEQGLFEGHGCSAFESAGRATALRSRDNSSPCHESGFVRRARKFVHEKGDCATKADLAANWPMATSTRAGFGSFRLAPPAAILPHVASGASPRVVCDALDPALAQGIRPRIRRRRPAQPKATSPRAAAGVSSRAPRGDLPCIAFGTSSPR